ncbi:pyridoxamine 5'-phosphate oxidase family protein [Nocardioides sp. MAH-18]|uniref:Pyridoxamine 5'-phosphate oxidase family protein n=1 Tax=Nocardioides agri TaxID=2682843 RepID=A0A6L6XS60_9ACTN|nr:MULTISPECIES: pyridoxamine 5'-phosphate oxidase family protein [unclassified Nocardioides]MBA2954808.1 pyridoxamine 5'-phosphate oxidase family protein [Nocardioides sp. CGMCC 1.13656]MVQ49662.1 pyridoxamine 5'-phosphate oxidase family protein [Nocardioides sp. MAH-18]
MTTGRTDPRFSEPTAIPPAWPEVERLLTDAELYWLTTVRVDGRPHSTPLVGVWHDGAFAFCTGVGEQKHLNLWHSGRVTVLTGRNDWRAGTDVVVEGTAHRVEGRERLAPLAAAWREKYGADWAWQADDEGFVAGDGTAPHVYVVPPAKVIAFGKDPHAQTTYRF